MIANAIEVTAVHFTAKFADRQGAFAIRRLFGVWCLAAQSGHRKTMVSKHLSCFYRTYLAGEIGCAAGTQTLHGECSARNLHQNSPDEYPDGSPGRRVVKILVF